MTDPRFLPARVLAEAQRDPSEGILGTKPGMVLDYLPHIYAVSGRQGIVSQSYLNYDEATRDSRENADKMRTDCGIMECPRGEDAGDGEERLTRFGVEVFPVF